MAKAQRQNKAATKQVKTKKVQSEETIDQYSSKMFQQLFVILLVILVAYVTQGYFRSPIEVYPSKVISPEVELTGVFAKNDRLANGIRKHGLLGPESIEEDVSGNIYTGLHDGRIVRVAPSSEGKIGEGEITTLKDGDLPRGVAKADDIPHGRPLGLRLIGDWLFVCDAILGVYKLNVKNNELKMLVALDDVTPAMRFPDDLTVTKDGRKIYFTDVSSIHSITKLGYLVLQGLCSGRIFEYDLEKDKVTVVVSDLCFPNGIQLSSDERSVFVCHSLHHKVNMYDITTWKVKKTTYMPIYPDNIRATGRGTYWVAGANPMRSFANQLIESSTFLRRIILGLLSHQQILSTVQDKYNIIVEMDKDGKVLQSLHDPNGNITLSVTQATELSDGRLALGSYKANWLGILDSKNVN